MEDALRWTAEVAFAVADRMINVVAVEPVQVTGDVAIIDVAIEEWERGFGLLLSDGQVFEVLVIRRRLAPPRRPHYGRRSI
jgi:hypothetical protein